jgi:hypothetical protein
MSARFAYLSAGQLYVRSEDGSTRRIESAFGDQVKQRAREIQARHSWKSEGRGARFMSAGLLWGAPGKDPALTQIAVRCVCRGTLPDEIQYVLDTDGLTGVCAWNAGTGIERRLLHGSERRIEHLAPDPTGAQVACSVVHRDGTAALGLMNADATDLTEITEGDVRDEAPSFVPGPSRRLVYQSAGMGRDRDGLLRGVGAFSIHEIDIDHGEVKTLAEDPKADLLCPRMMSDGTLLYIRRPRAREHGFSLPRAMLDTILFPFRLLYAFFQYLNFFSTRYTGKPLTTAGGPKQQGADARQMMIWGNLLGAEQAARQASNDEEPPAVVPRSWTLVRQRPGAGPEVIADSVGFFDLCRDGGILFTTGSAVYEMRPDGSRVRLLTAALVEQVVALD